MTRSGLQQDVINMYRQGVRNAMSKSPEARPNFMLHLRYNFRNPPLRQRDYTAIEHQLRRMSRTLEMLSEPSTQRMAVSDDWHSWWAEEVHRTKARVALRQSQTGPSASTSTHPEAVDTTESRSASPEGLGERGPTTKPSGAGDQKQVLKKDDTGRDRDQWAGTLPGHGGT